MRGISLDSDYKSAGSSAINISCLTALLRMCSAQFHSTGDGSNALSQIFDVNALDRKS